MTYLRHVATARDGYNTMCIGLLALLVSAKRSLNAKVELHHFVYWLCS